MIYYSRRDLEQKCPIGFHILSYAKTQCEKDVKCDLDMARQDNDDKNCYYATFSYLYQTKLKYKVSFKAINKSNGLTFEIIQRTDNFQSNNSDELDS
jgi:hypothetical protein